MRATDAPCAIVLGATGTLGSTVAERLVGRGLTVLACARTASALADISKPGVVTCVVDLESPEAGEVVAEAVDRPIAMVLTCVGLPAGGGLADLDLTLLPQSVDRKLGGWLRVIRAVDGRLAPDARLVALGGHYGTEPSPNAPLAGIVNAALANLVRQLADLYGPRGITAHLVSPGPVDSARMTAIATNAAARRGVTTEQVLDEYRAAAPLGRLTTPGEVAWAVASLLDPEAAALNGANLALDLGRRRGLP